jgi:DNA-directed RNA polymerase subunit M/transcription elongation factor TFIIS
MKTGMILAALGMMAVIGLLPPCGQAAGEDPGAAEIVLQGGPSGNVLFPHRRHEEKLPDCNLCHAAYPKQPRAIEVLKEQGTLKKKEIMNTQCTKCHKERKSAGEAAGPTTCTGCHTLK